MQHGRARQSFTVTAVNAAYATEELSLDSISSGAGAVEFQALVEALPTGCTLELWILRVDGDVSNSGHYINSGISYDAVGLQDLLPLGQWRGKVRAKSGGSAGTAIVSAVVS